MNIYAKQVKYDKSISFMLGQVAIFLGDLISGRLYIGRQVI